MPVTDLYDHLTLLPPSAADYQVEEFTTDLLRLDRQPNATAASLHRFELGGSTGRKGGKKLTLFDEADEHHYDYATLLARQRDQWLTAGLWDDPTLALDFRAAMLSLSTQHMKAEGDTISLQWLRGEHLQAVQLRAADISVRIGRTNARAMWANLCHLIRKCDATGLPLLLDIMALSRNVASERSLR